MFCKDCRYREEVGYCNKFYRMTEQDDFCSWGEGKAIPTETNICKNCIHRCACQTWNTINILTLNTTECANFEEKKCLK
jgi:hypothetical protein